MNELVFEAISLECKLMKYGVNKDLLLDRKAECLGNYLPEELHDDAFAIDYFYRMYLIDLNKILSERIDYLTNTAPRIGEYVNESVHKRYGDGRMRVDK